MGEKLFILETNSACENQRDSDELLDIKSKIKYMKSYLLKIISLMIKIKKCFIYLFNNENKKISIINYSQAIIYGGISYDNKRNLL